MRNSSYEQQPVPPVIEPHWAPVVIRLATAADRSALEHLAELDSAKRPCEPTLLAELGDRVVAALELARGRVIADPFVATRDIQELLWLRASQLESVGARSTGAWRRFGRTAASVGPPDRRPDIRAEFTDALRAGAPKRGVL
jgi:hypothetical protein